MVTNYQTLPVKIKVTLKQYEEIAKMSKKEWEDFSNTLVKNLELPSGNYKVQIGFQVVVDDVCKK